MLSENSKRLLNWLGTVLSVLSVLFIGFRLSRYGDELKFIEPGSPDLLFHSILVFIYSLSGLLLTCSWKQILAHLGVQVTCLNAFRIYGKSQISKYIPGNIFHFVGRQAIGIQNGMSGLPLAKSAFVEIVVLAVSGGLFFSMALPMYSASVTIPAAIVLFTVSLCLTLAATTKIFSRYVASAVLLDVIFLITSGIVFVGVLYKIEPQVFDSQFSSVFVICGAYILSWLAGFLTPGAPAGVGVREVVLLWILGSSVSEAALLSSILIARIITVLGDVLFFGCALSFRNTGRKAN